jgi:RNA polymerase sigma factor (sigma-70 family)
LLSARQEQLLFRRLNYLKFQANQLRSRLDRHRPDGSLLDRLEFLIQEAERTAEILVTANIRLAVSIVRRVQSAAMPFDDLLSDGMLALIRAVEKFDESRGFRFSTYATLVVRRELFRAIQSAQIVQSQRRSIDRSEVASSLLPATAPRLPAAHWSALYESLESMIRLLDPRERQIVRARFGYEPMATKPSLQAVATQLGICKERVRQLEKRALTKLNEMAEARGLRHLLSELK